MVKTNVNGWAGGLFGVNNFIWWLRNLYVSLTYKYKTTIL